MRMLATSASVLAVLLLIAASPHASTSDTPEELVAKLGSAKYLERESAHAALDKLGEAALPALRDGIKSANAEVRSRSFVLLQRIEDRVEAAKAVAGTKLRLKYDDAPLSDALKDFADKSGLCFLIDPNDAALQDRKITLDTGETTLWRALELFCQKSGLDEQRIDTLGGAPGMFNAAKLIVPSPSNATPTFIGLADAKGKWTPALSHGGIRLRALGKDERSRTQVLPPPGFAPAIRGFVVELTPEPAMTWQCASALRVTHAVDEHGQQLVQPETYLLERVPDPLFGLGAEAAGIGIWTDDTSLGLHDTSQYRHVVARFIPGLKPSQMLKEVRGVVTAEILAKQTLVGVDDPATSVDMEFGGPGGVLLRIEEVKREDRQVTMKVCVSYKRGLLWLRQGVVVRTDGSGDMHVDPNLGHTSFTLTNGPGKELTPENIEHFAIANHQGDPCLWAGYVLSFTLPEGQESIGGLTYRGMRLRSIEIPFVLHDVPMCDEPTAPAPSSILHRALWKGGE